MISQRTLTRRFFLFSIRDISENIMDHFVCLRKNVSAILSDLSYSGSQLKGHVFCIQYQLCYTCNFCYPFH